MNFLNIFLLFFLPSLAFSSSIEILDTNHISTEFIVQIEEIPSHNFLGVGSLISLRHVLTIKSIFIDLQPPDGILLRFRSIYINQGLQIQPDKFFPHPSENLAILKTTRRVNEQFHFSPRYQTSLLLGRFCTLYGFNDNRLVAVPAFIEPCGNENSKFCVNRNSSEFQGCGFSGGSVICDSEKISAVVQSDEFCGVGSSRAILIDLGEHLKWIEKTSGSGRRRGELIGVFIVFLILLGFL